ncbi:Endonuclease V [Hondaea fermentalgiana]|uniref:Endonuclease V n=1 Tax=Hondaea fermentalgiana TaxID=2315210 RepID=A0A2R5G4C2_9STRA|nr:Endonuclease V [Hondaea fermentalgiana]|eukprot:GBG24638.1 Endonuclease V [Hondaea fermentalgiana]
MSMAGSNTTSAMATATASADGHEGAEVATNDQTHEATKSGGEDAELAAKLDGWRYEQQALRARLSLKDDNNDGDAMASWTYFGGVDVSFVKGTDQACASLVVLHSSNSDSPAQELKVVYEDFALVTMDEPYVAGFLAFREVKFLKALWQRLEARIAEKRPDEQNLRLPEVVLVDGNGIMHPEGFGLASHLGVELDVRTVGVAKTFLHVDGITKDVMAAQLAATPRAASGFTATRLVGASKRCWGCAVLPLASLSKPIFVSQGHRVSLETALEVVRRCSAYRIPEPVRQADLRSREWLRNHDVQMP